jgi:NADH dehydrogenase
LRALGIDVVSGDFRDRASLERATVGVRAVVSTVTVIARVFAGEKGANFDDVDVSGHRHLIAAAEVAGVERFLFVSATSMRFPEAVKTPLGKGKIWTERALSGSHLREVIMRPDQLQEIWLSPAAQFDWPNRKVIIFGKGETPVRYVATDDVAEAAAKLVLVDDPPRLVELGGPQALTRKQAVAVFESQLGYHPGAPCSARGDQGGERRASPPAAGDGLGHGWRASGRPAPGHVDRRAAPRARHHSALRRRLRCGRDSSGEPLRTLAWRPRA